MVQGDPSPQQVDGPLDRKTGPRREPGRGKRSLFSTLAPSAGFSSFLKTIMQNTPPRVHFVVGTKRRRGKRGGFLFFFFSLFRLGGIPLEGGEPRPVRGGGVQGRPPLTKFMDRRIKALGEEVGSRWHQFMLPKEGGNREATTPQTSVLSPPKRKKRHCSARIPSTLKQKKKKNEARKNFPLPSARAPPPLPPHGRCPPIPSPPVTAFRRGGG